MGRDRRALTGPNGLLRALIREHTFAGPDLTERLDAVSLEGTKLNARYTLDDLEDLLGFVAAEANRSEDKRFRNELDHLYDLIRKTMDRYDDGNWQTSGT